MDFVKLGGAYSTNYTPTGLVEGYNSLIWTERFQPHGEFELKSYDVAGVKQQLPEGTFVSHLETEEVMMVETHSTAVVGEGEDAAPEITVKGRVAASIFDDRYVETDYQKKRRMRKKYTATGALTTLMYNAVVNNSGKDLTRGDDDPDTEGVVNSYDWTTKDVLPNVLITEAVADEGTTRWWQLEGGLLYPQLEKIMLDQDLGIRGVRPVLPNSVKVITVASALASRGNIAKTAMNNVTGLRFEVYSGIDRSDSVQFSLLQGHVLTPQYLESIQATKTAFEVMSDSIDVKDVYLPGAAGYTGWRRKVGVFDAGTPELPKQPEKPDELRANATSAQKQKRKNDMEKWIDAYAKWKNKKNRIAADFREEQTKAAMRELKKLRRIDMFSGDISDLSPYKYKTHYNLGDTVNLVGDYGKTAKMLVSEYVRTEDANGDRGFPGLVAP